MPQPCKLLGVSPCQEAAEGLTWLDERHAEQIEEPMPALSATAGSVAGLSYDRMAKARSGSRLPHSVAYCCPISHRKIKRSQKTAHAIAPLSRDTA